jgi:RNA polymerase sigma-70 factor (ECF subfamily)
MQPGNPFTDEQRGLDFHKATLEMENVLSSRGRSLYRNAYRLLGNPADAEDAVQDALLSAYKHLGEFRGESQMLTWLTAIVINSARMRLRRRSGHDHLSLDGPIGEDQQYSMSEQLKSHGPSPEDECRSSELTARVTELLMHLSPSMRKAFELRDLNGLSTREAAQILGVGEGTLKAQLSRARTKIRQLIIRMRNTGTLNVTTRKKQVRFREPYSSNTEASCVAFVVTTPVERRV